MEEHGSFEEEATSCQLASLLPFFLELLSHNHHHCDMNKISQDKEEE
jgi:hypothetical protein